MRHCFDVHVALDIGDRDATEDEYADVERLLNEARDGLVLLQVDLGGRGDVSITVEEAWPIGDRGSTQPLVDEMEADAELMSQLRPSHDDLLAQAVVDIERAVATLTEVIAREGGAR